MHLILTSFSHLYRLIGFVSRVFANGPGDLGSIPGRVISKTLKMVFDTSLLGTQQYKVCVTNVSRVKWSNPGEGVAPSPTSRCSSYWKGSLLVALDYSRQLYLVIQSLTPIGVFVCRIQWENVVVEIVLTSLAVPRMSCSPSIDGWGKWPYNSCFTRCCFHDFF